MAMMLDEQVRHNKAATVWLFVVVFLILAALVFAVGVVLGYPPIFTGILALVIGLVYLGIASSTGVDTILRAARARPANPAVREEKLLIYAVEEMAIAAGIHPIPKVYVQEDDDINAFATGRDYKEAIVCATTGALNSLTQEELQGVIGHELSHIRNQDIKVTTYAIALIGLIAMLGEIMFRSMLFGGGRRGGSREGGGLLLIFAIVFIILAPILSKMVYFAISRRREYLADASGAELTRNPEGLAAALEKIASRQPHPDKGDRTVSALYLDNPFRRLKANTVFSTHPPLEERIRRLRGQGDP
ncbi:MAG TPA: M48 family metalloprotease [Candidatus Thermoplasmatota archaeon]|nr:M48 family metalloprotease [Candidatus Thermoplasmatota archaeon]